MIMSAVLTHLWVSTLVLLGALILARVLPLTARTRHALLTGGLLKLAIPSAAIVVPLRLLGLDLEHLTHASNAAISMQWLGGPVVLRAAGPHPESRWPQAVAIAWIVTACVLAIVWAVGRSRMIASALHTTSPASPREHAALAAARRSLGLRASVDVMRSSVCEAPAVVRIIRPVVVLPDGGCDALDDAELESLLRHECAHVARRDNLLGLGESAIVAAFWFHPLVWIAQRAIATAREEACDETAAATGEAIETYISALSKICRAVLAPRLAGVSCMASAHLKERLSHLMRYELLRNRALSHRLVVALAAIAIAAMTIGGSLRAAPSPSDANDQTRYLLKVSVRPAEQPDTLVFIGRVIDMSVHHAIAQPSVTFKRGSGATVRTEADGRVIEIDVHDTGDKVSAHMRISENGVQQQESTYTASAKETPYEGLPPGAKISLSLKDADLKDVLDKFGKMTNSTITYPPSLNEKVTLSVKDVPWNEVFAKILQDHGLTYEVHGNTIAVTR
jgi:beta-lactamase regulating signal transducer with metallopeptidase domain